MAKRKRSVGDSLDLLLDTICNTFGGVLFIALLVIIMLNQSSQTAEMSPPGVVSQAELAQAMVDLQSTDSELDGLQRALAEQRKIAAKIDQPDIRRSMTSVMQSQQAVTDKMIKQSMNLQEAAKSQEDVNKIAEELKKLEVALQTARQQLAAAEQALEEEANRRERKLTLPKQKDTTKEERACFLKAGRFSGATPEEIDQTMEGGVVLLSPKASAGVKADPGSVASRLAAFNPSQHFVAIVVYPDSFGDFEGIRNLLVEKGFEYRLILVPEGEKVSIGAQSNVKVQGS